MPSPPSTTVALDVEGDTTIYLTARWDGCPPESRLEWIVDGQPRERLSLEGQGAKTWTLPGGSAHWSLITLREAGGRMLALTNPIFFDGRS